MEIMFGISLYTYLYPKLTKTICLSYYLLCFLFNKINKIREESKTGSSWKQRVGVGWVGWEVAQTKYTCISKCENDKIEGEKNLKRQLREKYKAVCNIKPAPKERGTQNQITR
jgi:hypothetical protein